MRDRRLTRREAVRLNRMLDKNSRKINGLRHNRFVRLLGPIPIRLERPDRIRVPTPRELSAHLVSSVLSSKFAV